MPSIFYNEWSPEHGPCLCVGLPGGTLLSLPQALALLHMPKGTAAMTKRKSDEQSFSSRHLKRLVPLPRIQCRCS